MKSSILFLFISLFTLTAAFAQPGSTEIKVGLNHIALSVTDLQESEVFYRDIIGLEQIEEPFKLGIHAWFAVGNTQLHVIESAEERRERSIYNHLCFSVSDMEFFIKTLEDNKITYRSWEGEIGEVTLRTDGVQQIYFTDPDGFWIEVNDDM